MFCLDQKRTYLSLESDPPENSEAIAFGERVDQMARAAGSRIQAAEIAKITVQQLGRIVSGRSPGASALTLGRLAQATGYNLHWIVTGEGEPRRSDAPAVPATPPLDPNLFGRITDAIGRAYKDAGVQLSDVDLGRLAATEYELVASLASNEDEQIAVAKMVKNKHAKRLGTESLATRKRGA
jgi:hypothetical protein